MYGWCWIIFKSRCVIFFFLNIIWQFEYNFFFCIPIGNEWKTHRKLLNPTVQNYNFLTTLYPMFNENIRILINRLEAKCDSNEFDIYEFIESCTLDIIAGN